MASASGMASALVTGLASGSVMVSGSGMETDSAPAWRWVVATASAMELASEWALAWLPVSVWASAWLRASVLAKGSLQEWAWAWGSAQAWASAWALAWLRVSASAWARVTPWVPAQRLAA
jgi:hypothetical protein